VFRLEREADRTQYDHIEVGFRSTMFYGMDYRYTVASGWWPGTDEFQKHNDMYGWDPIEQEPPGEDQG